MVEFDPELPIPEIALDILLQNETNKALMGAGTRLKRVVRWHELQERRAFAEHCFQARFDALVATAGPETAELRAEAEKAYRQTWDAAKDEARFS